MQRQQICNIYGYLRFLKSLPIDILTSKNRSKPFLLKCLLETLFMVIMLNKYSTQLCDVQDNL